MQTSRVQQPGWGTHTGMPRRSSRKKTLQSAGNRSARPGDGLREHDWPCLGKHATGTSIRRTASTHPSSQNRGGTRRGSLGAEGNTGMGHGPWAMGNGQARPGQGAPSLPAASLVGMGCTVALSLMTSPRALEHTGRVCGEAPSTRARGGRMPVLRYCY